MKIALWGLAAAAITVCVILFRLIYIAEPEKAMSVQFQGFVLLPKEATLTVLDYLTVSGNDLFVTGETTGSVYKIKLPAKGIPTNDDVAVFASDPAAHGVALDSSKKVAFVTRSEADVVEAFDPATMKSIERIRVAEDADAIMFDPLHNLLYIAHGDAHLATLIDPQTRAVIATIPLGGKPEFVALDLQTQLLYQNLNDLNAVAAIDVVTRSLTQRWDLPGCHGPSGMAIDEASRRLFIACAGNAKLVVFDLDAHRVTTSVPIGGGPDSVAFDSELHRIYTAGKAGVLSVIRQDGPDSYHVLDSVKLHYGAHTLAVDPRTHKVYVGYASLISAARVAVFEPQ